MSWWGKVIGGTVGFFVGGPLGAVLGASVGHGYDTFQENEGAVLPGGNERVQTVFFTATFSVMGYLAKADGRVSEEEIAAVRRIMDSMQMTGEQQKTAINLFNEGKRKDFPLDTILGQFRRECRGRRNLVRMFLEILLTMAMADGELHESERRILYHVAEGVGYPGAELDRLLRMMEAERQGRRQSRSAVASREISLNDAYGVLGLPKNVSDEDLKKTYRRLIMQYHPDTLVSKGLPEEMMNFASEKTRTIKAAYDVIRESRRRH
ncbi:MAG: co-chaperone DjlA [Syntrophales bacterium]|jgi:DnaJ like chaperone protein|nr:co-chaperone DjlA [Syntrophales bacterium]MCK9528273.1 co-chaperone DjlA [Syntrophales bacterium]MDX9922405.1 co-chaperone DjlA [Syntrophales bacterium]